MTDPTRPTSIVRAVRLMYVGAALQLVFGVAMAILAGRLRDDPDLYDEFAVAAREAGKSEAEVPGLIDDAVHSWRLGWLVATAVIIAVWLALAWINRRGYRWARTATTTALLLAVVVCAYVLLGGLNVVAVLAIVLCGAILYLIYRPDAAAYYDGAAAPRQEDPAA